MHLELTLIFILTKIYYFSEMRATFLSVLKSVKVFLFDCELGLEKSIKMDIIVERNQKFGSKYF